MKHRIAWLLGLTLFIAPAIVHAQKRAGAAVGFGVKLGLTVTTFGGDDADDIPFTEFEDKLGVAAGGLISIEMTPLVSLQPELLFVTKGADVEILGDDVGYVSATYLEVPLLVRLNIPAGESLAPFVVLGPGLGFLVSAEEVDNDGNSTNIEDDAEGLDLGLIIGGGLGVPLSSGGTLEFEIRYEHGLKDTYEDSDVDLENRAFFILGGYRF